MGNREQGGVLIDFVNLLVNTKSQFTLLMDQDLTEGDFLSRVGAV